MPTYHPAYLLRNPAAKRGRGRPPEGRAGALGVEIPPRSVAGGCNGARELRRAHEVRRAGPGRPLRRAEPAPGGGGVGASSRGASTPSPPRPGGPRRPLRDGADRRAAARPRHPDPRWRISRPPCGTRRGAPGGTRRGFLGVVALDLEAVPDRIGARGRPRRLLPVPPPPAGCRDPRARAPDAPAPDPPRPAPLLPPPRQRRTTWRARSGGSDRPRGRPVRDRPSARRATRRAAAGLGSAVVRRRARRAWRRELWVAHLRPSGGRGAP